jgi:hypothetical protein
MSEHDDSWNPADGPPPTEEELAEARALADALSGGARKKTADPEMSALLDVALRVKSTAHPDRERSNQVAAAAVEQALVRADASWYRKRWRWVAFVAALVLGVTGVQLAQFRPVHDDTVPLISHPASDVFNTALPDDARSMPIGRMTDVRMRSYRDVLLHAEAGER